GSVCWGSLRGALVGGQVGIAWSILLPVITPDRLKGEGWIGSLVYFDLIRITRRGREWLLRCCYALFLLVGLYLVYRHLFPSNAELPVLFGDGPRVPPAQVARFAGTFATSVFVLQCVAILAMAPAFLASAITEEKERGTLELLFTSHLSDQEIMLSKLLGRIVRTIGVLLAGLPVFFVLQWWGGVEPF